jgi:transposase
MIGLAAGTRIWIVAGVTDMRRGFVGLSGMVQTALAENPFSGQVFVFRGKRGDLITSCCGGMAMGCACSRSGWSAGSSPGRKRRTALFR